LRVRGLVPGSDNAWRRDEANANNLRNHIVSQTEITTTPEFSLS